MSRDYGILENLPCLLHSPAPAATSCVRTQPTDCSAASRETLPKVSASSPRIVTGPPCTMPAPVSVADEVKPRLGEAYAGKEHKWAVSPRSRLNDKLISLTPTLLLLLVPVYLNQTATALALYAWLNDNYSPFEINVR